MATVRVGKLEQELIFFIGPPSSGTEPILEEFVEPQGKSHEKWLTLLDDCLGKRIYPDIIITVGGKRGFETKCLHLDLVKTIIPDGSPLFSAITPVETARICLPLCELFNVDWVDLWYTGLLGNSQINCDRGGKAIHFFGGGRKVELDVDGSLTCKRTLTAAEDKRPDYFAPPKTREEAVLRKIKGNFRREMIAESIKGEGLNSIPEAWLKHDISATLKSFLQRQHPQHRGGEDLPDLLKGEVEIARLSLLNTVHGEVTSLRARPSSRGISYRVVDEYDSKFEIRPKTSRKPLTLGQVIQLIDGMTVDGEPDSPAAFRNCLEGLDDEDSIIQAKDSVLVSSVFYPDLQIWYEQEATRWTEALLADLPSRQERERELPDAETQKIEAATDENDPVALT